MFKLEINEWILVISISFQLAGAILLLLKYCFKKIKKQVKESTEKENHVEGARLILGATQPKTNELIGNILLNRVSFVEISLGYLISIFGFINQTPRYILFIWILIISTILVFASYFLSTKFGGEGK